MDLSQDELVNAIRASIKELQDGIDMHCCLVTSIVEGRADASNLQPLLTQCPQRMREDRLKAAIKEAIDELEESRKAFKSKRLERLRKHLIQVLIDNDS